VRKVWYRTKDDLRKALVSADIARNINIVMGNINRSIGSVYLVGTSSLREWKDINVHKILRASDRIK
jgi:hypothetical protein